MLTGELRNQIDRVWDTFWTGGISNPIEVIEQITYLLFLKRLDEAKTARMLPLDMLHVDDAAVFAGGKLSAQSRPMALVQGP